MLKKQDNGMGFVGTLNARDWKGADNFSAEEGKLVVELHEDRDVRETSDSVGERYVVRRLTPLETERLQGFPDGWTDLSGCDVNAIAESVSDTLGYDKGSASYEKLCKNVEKWSKDTPDTPRYKAMGNSMTTYVIEILGRRIQAYDELHYDEVGLESAVFDS